MERFIYRIQPTRPDMLTTGPNAQEDELIEQHFSYLLDLTRQGVALLVGRTLNTDPGVFGLVIYQAESQQHAREIMEADPAVAGGVMAAELFPFRIIMHNQIKD